MYKGPTDKEMWGDGIWEREVGRAGESNGGKGRTPVIEQQYFFNVVNVTHISCISYREKKRASILCLMLIHFLIRRGYLKMNLVYIYNYV